MNWNNFFAGIYFSLLPKRWWGKWHMSSTTDFARAGVVSGLIEFVFFACLTLLWFVRFMIGRSKLVAGVGMNEGTQLWVLAIFFVDFLIQPSSIVLVYFTLEGFARGYSAWLHGTVLPTLPFFVVARWQSRRERTFNDKAFAPLLPDTVETVSPTELRIASSRPKDWTPTTTISYREQMWELIGSEEITGERKFVYQLKVRTSSVAIRAIRQYSPEPESR